MTKLLD